jgi:transcriptional regulator with XRE-family HTH domain
LLLDLRQEDVARQLGTLREVYDRWERDERVPVISEWPRILVFLSYYPFAIITPGDLVLKARRCQGFDQKRLAKAVGVIHQRLRRWERGFEPVATSVMDRLSGLAHLPLITSATCSLVTAAAGLVEQQVTS